MPGRLWVNRLRLAQGSISCAQLDSFLHSERRFPPAEWARCVVHANTSSRNAIFSCYHRQVNVHFHSTFEYLRYCSQRQDHFLVRQGTCSGT